MSDFPRSDQPPTERAAVLKDAPAPARAGAFRRAPYLALSLAFALAFLASAFTNLETASAKGKKRKASDAEAGRTYVGSATCATCHDDQMKTIRGSKHVGVMPKVGREEKRLDRGCEECHGAGSAHVADPGVEGSIRNFKAEVGDAREIVDACLKCHDGEKFSRFKVTAHGGGGLSCVACHKAHAASTDDREAKRKEVEACLACHQNKRTALHLPSRHPLHEGKMACSDCHDPHGTPGGGPGLLVKENLNETCLTCHANLAGPHTFTHPPAAESCLNCHKPHGSVIGGMLKQQEPGLCLSCHHTPHQGWGERPNTADGNAVTGANPAVPGLGRGRSLRRFLGYQACSHCHTQVHGADENQHLFH